MARTKKKQCECCQTRKELAYVSNHSYEETSVIVYIVDNLLHVQLCESNFEHIETTPINYCPKCGRRLNEVQNETT